MLNAVLERYDIFLFILARMTGFVFFNPIFGRRNIPGMSKAAITLVLAVFTVMHFTDDYTPVEVGNVTVFTLLLIKEFAFGFLIGTIVNMFFSVVAISGEVMDMQMGLGMSNMYDPGSNIQMAITGQFHNIALMLMFFLLNAHLNLIHIIMLSFRISPVDSIYFNPEIGIYLMELFGEIMILSLKFAFPVIAAELITETGVGIIMRAVPQINVFVVGLQLKILAGLAIMIVAAPISIWFFDEMLRDMQASVIHAIAAFGS
jgi:flagellar biosynthetic protein FliR